MIPVGFLHDIGKPYIAFQDEKDKITDEYSFHNYEDKFFKTKDNI